MKALLTFLIGFCTAAWILVGIIGVIGLNIAFFYIIKAAWREIVDLLVFSGVEGICLSLFALQLNALCKWRNSLE